MATRERPGRRGRTKAVTGLRVLGVASVLAVAAIVGWFYWWGDDDRQIRADAGNAELVALGRTVYAEHCAACHGRTLEGQPNWRVRGADGVLPAPPHDETGHTWHHPDRQLFDITKEGGQPGMPAGFKSGMPGFEGTLTDRQIIAVIAYIKSRWPDTIRRRQEALTRRSR